MTLFFLALLAGVLTALAPCVLPLLPIIVGSALGGQNKRRPYVIVGSLIASLFFFTAALKATSTLLNVPPVTWQIISGGIILVLGITSIWPHLYERFATKTGFLKTSQKFLGGSATRGGLAAAALTGVALGPVFSSCSPTYALILATVLPVSFAAGLAYLGVYILGLGAMLLAVIAVGRRLTSKLGWALNPDGWFKRGLGVVFVLIGIAVLTGYDKKVESYIEGIKLVNISNLETGLLPSNGRGLGTVAVAPNGAKFAVASPQPAPELKGISTWINSDGETLASLKGKVVLIDFWTYSCINCIHTLPHVTGWYDKYKDKGLVVLGIHAPEFSFEHVASNVAKAVKDDNIHYPVGLDNNFDTWNAYGNQYWPAKYFIDRQGNIRHYKFGEGDYANDELVIQALLSEGGTAVTDKLSDASASQSADHSPETYLGYERASGNASSLKHDVSTLYQLPDNLKSDGWALGGMWTAGSQQTVSGTDARLTYKFTGKQVYLVMGASTPARVTVKVNGQLVTAAQVAGADVGADGQALVGDSRLYRLVKSDKLLKDATLELDLPTGVAVNAFTFDS